MENHQLSTEQLRKTYSPEVFEGFKEAIPKYRKAIIGQERAVKALRFGLGNRAPGFNVYVSTSDNNGKYSVIKHFLKEMAKKDPPPNDWCYVNNFKNPYCPNVMRLPSGLAIELKKDIDSFIIDAEIALVKTLESEEFLQNINSIKQELAEQQLQLFSEINQKAEKENFVLKRTPMEIMTIPKKGDQAMTSEEFQLLPEKERKKILKKQKEFQGLLQNLVKKSLELERKTTEQLMGLEQNNALFAIEVLLENLLKKYNDVPEVPEHLEDLKNDILENLSFFLQPDPPNMQIAGRNAQKKILRQRYEVNVIVDNSELKNAPIIVELNPTYNNLFGKIERESVMGTLNTNFTLIREGALHHANGGYLIIPIDDLLRAPFSWENLKRAIRNNQIEIEDATEKLGFITIKSLKPEPIHLDVQVVLVGQHHLFQLLYQLDDDFKNLFKVKAHFDSVMLASKKNLKEFCGYIFCVQKEENLLPVNNNALAKMIEQGHRLANHQEKISTEMEETADLLREAHYYAKEESATEILGEHIQKSIREKIYRTNLLHEKIKELIEKKVIMIDVEGEKIGQINGLSVIDIGDIAFGRPSRITTSISIGKGDIIDIEREAELGGAVHTKGVLILSGFLFNKFGKDKPLNLSIRLVFEQSYSGVEGDSASSAELYAVLSGLSGLPIRQEIAVTGSVNQNGEIQPVGGINEKIEGYFEVCQLHGLTGKQGVIIPSANTANLMLKEEVVKAVDEGKFKIWAIQSVDEGIEILTGTKAGETFWDEISGTLSFEEDSVYFKVNERLEQMTKTLKKLKQEGNGLAKMED